MRSWCVCAWVLAAAVSALLAASAEARSPGSPDPGNWEGKGPYGLALSFQLGRTHNGIHAQALAVTVPVGCPADVRNALAVAGTTKTIYAGPGAAPPGLSHPIGTRPGTMGLSLNAAQYRVVLEGSLVDHRRAVLTMGTPAGRQMTCWPRVLRFEARSAPRISVMDGRWAGALKSTNGVTGTVRLEVSGSGRDVSSFSFALYCPGSSTAGRPNYGFGPDVNGQFIAPDGTFSGPAAHSVLPGLQIVWQGRFSPGSLTGSLTNLGDPCGLGGSQSASFTARHAP